MKTKQQKEKLENNKSCPNDSWMKGISIQGEDTNGKPSGLPLGK